MKIVAAIFDLDGTVILDEDIYANAFRKILKKAGIVEKKKDFHKGGIGVEENWKEFIIKYKLKTTKSAEQLTEETYEEFLNHASDILINPGFSEFIQEIRTTQIMTALATSTVRKIADEILTRLNLYKYFDSITTGDEVKNKKPDPDIFLLAAEKLSVNPTDCVVFEDSEAGIVAAQKAGMVPIQVNNLPEIVTKNVILSIKTFKEINLDILTKL